MEQDQHKDLDNSDGLIDRRQLMHEAHEELIATRKTVTDLLNYKRSLIDIEHNDFEKINEIKGKAIDAINHLFNDIMNTKK